jgi:hypothetical protein
MRVPALSRLDLELRSDMGLAIEEPRIIKHTLRSRAAEGRAHISSTQDWRDWVPQRKSCSMVDIFHSY